MTCKDCIHYEVCEDLRYGDISNCNVKDCGGFFKNKADFVEVIRCKDCKHYDYGRCSKISYIMDGYYQGSFEVKKPTDFCSYGERSDT
jgi:hypothetical protein